MRIKLAALLSILLVSNLSNLNYWGVFGIPLLRAEVGVCLIYVDLLGKSDILQQKRNVPSKCQEKSEGRPIIRLQVERKRTALMF